MNELKSQEQLKKELSAPLPPEAVKPHPTKPYLSSIKAIYVTERLNDVFGIGKWSQKVKTEKEGEKGMIVVHVTLEIPDYGIYYESFGGNDNGGETNKNFDLGDAYKGATTDGITKICSYLGIGIQVFKGLGNTAPKPQPKPEAPQKPVTEYTTAIMKEVDACQTKEELAAVWKKYPELGKTNDDFKSHVTDKGNSL